MKGFDMVTEIPVPQYILNGFEQVIIHPDSLESAVAQRVLKYFPKEKIQISADEPFANLQNKMAAKSHKGSLTKEQFDRSKKILMIKKFDGYFFKRCPGAHQQKALTCCNYFVLNLGQQCNFNCSYCYLQSYLNSPIMYVFSNIDQALEELASVANEHPDLPYRVGTGEVTDSLSIDELTLYSRQLISFFKKYPKWILEFKTKSDYVEQFLDCEHAGNIVVSWSINAEEIVNSEEHLTASLTARLQAARRCKDRGFQVAFHIDPLIHHPNWQQGYTNLVAQVCELFRPEEVQVISLGALRFQPEQRHLMRERFGMNSYVTKGELFLSEGGKMRYDASVRQDMYNFVLQAFKVRSPDWKVFLCMETPENWIESLDSTPMQIPTLRDFFRPLPKISHEKNHEKIHEH